MIIVLRTQFLNVKAVVAAFNQEKALVGAFSVITNLRMEFFEALVLPAHLSLVSLMSSWLKNSTQVPAPPSPCRLRNTARS